MVRMRPMAGRMGMPHALGDVGHLRFPTLAAGSSGFATFVLRLPHSGPQNVEHVEATFWIAINIQHVSNIEAAGSRPR